MNNKTLVLTVLISMISLLAFCQISPSKLRSEIEEELQKVVTDLKSDVNCGNTLDNGDRSVKWHGTDAATFQEAINAVFLLSYDAGTEGREAWIKIDLVAGGEQKDFENTLSNYLISNPIDLNNPTSFDPRELAREIASKTPINVFNKRMHTYYNCEFDKDKRCIWQDYAYEGNDGKKKCERASGEKLYEDFCGYYGTFVVTIKLRRPKKNASGCRPAIGNINEEEYCLGFTIRPTLPPGIFQDPSLVHFAFTCDNGTSTVYRMNPDVSDQDGVAWSDDINKPSDEWNHSAGYNLVENSGLDKTMYAKYYKSPKLHECNKVYGPTHTHKSIPIRDLEVVPPLKSTEVLCKPTCDTINIKSFVNPSYSQIKRNVRWYTTLDDYSEEPFHEGQSYIGCFNETTTFFISYFDEYPDKPECNQETTRSQFTIIVLDDIIDEEEDLPVPIKESHSIFDTREFSRNINCTENDSFHVELETVLDPEIITQNIEDNEDVKDIQEVHGYEIKVNSAQIEWFLIDSNGDEISYNPNAQTSIYKKDQASGKLFVCSENTGIATGDHDTWATYQGKITYSYEVTNANGELVSPKEECFLQTVIEKNIRLKGRGEEACSDLYDHLLKQISEGALADDCDSWEAISICPKYDENKKIGLEPEEIDELFPFAIVVNRKWSPREGLISPNKSRTSLNYNTVEVDNYKYQKYVYSMTPLAGLLQRRKVKHCAFVYKCPICDDSETPNDAIGLDTIID